jgi:hypothetical protein
MPEILQDYEPDHPRWRIRAEANLTVLSTEASPDGLELTIGLSSDRKWARGAPISRRGGRHTYSGLQYNSRLGEKRSPTDHAADLMVRLRPNVAGIARVSERATTFGVTLWVVEHTHAEDRQIDVSPEDLKTLAAMGARLSVDLYVYGEDDD